MVFNNVSSSLSCPFSGWLFWPDWKWFGLESLKGFPIHSQLLQKALMDRIKQAAIIEHYLQAKYCKTRFFCTSFWLKLYLSLRARCLWASCVNWDYHWAASMSKSDPRDIDEDAILRGLSAEELDKLECELLEMDPEVLCRTTVWNYSMDS